MNCRSCDGLLSHRTPQILDSAIGPRHPHMGKHGKKHHGRARDSIGEPSPNHYPIPEVLKMQRFLKTNGQPLPLDILPDITKVIYAGKYHEEVTAARLWCCTWLKAEDLMKPDGLAAGLRSVSWIKSNTGVGDSKAPVLFGGSLGMLDLKSSSNDTPDLFPIL